MNKSKFYYACIHPFLGMTVHCKGCKKLQQEGQVFLGSFYEYHQAMAVAKRRYTDINYCSDCLEMKPEIEPVVVVVESRTRATPPVTVKTKAEPKTTAAPVRTCNNPDTRRPVRIPELKPKANINRVPRKHAPGNY